jgi:hypothetical protein
MFLEWSCHILINSKNSGHERIKLPILLFGHEQYAHLMCFHECFLKASNLANCIRSQYISTANKMIASKTYSQGSFLLTYSR